VAFPSRPYAATVGLLALIAGCAVSTPPYAAGDFDALVAAVPGGTVLNPDFSPGTVKMAPRTRTPLKMFNEWCDARKGLIVRADLAVTRPDSAVEFVHALAERGNAAQARLQGYTPHDAFVCVQRSKEDRLLAAVIVEPYKLAGQDSASAQTVALFNADEASAFSQMWAVRGAERAARVKAETEKDLNRQTREASSIRSRLRTNPKVGDRTSLGMIVEIRPPLVLIQHDNPQAKSPTAWYRIDDLNAP